MYLQTPQEYLRRYQQINRGAYSKFHGYAFDGVWVIAKAVHDIVRQHNMTNGTSYLPSSLFRGQHIASTLNRTNFRGVSVGNVSDFAYYQILTLGPLS